MKKIKRIILGGILMVFAQAAWSQAGIDFFHGPFAKAQLEAEETGKLIFMDAYATWCGPCKYMSANSFTDSQVGDLFNAAFVNLKMDMERGEGPRLSRIYSVRAYPTLFIMNSEGKVLEKLTGALGAEQLHDWATQAIEKHIPQFFEQEEEVIEEAPSPQSREEDMGHVEESDFESVEDRDPAIKKKPAKENLVDREVKPKKVQQVAPIEDDGNALDDYLPMYNHSALADMEEKLIKAVEAKDRERMMELSHQLLQDDDMEHKMLFVEAWRAWAIGTDNVQDMVINVSEMMALEENPSALLLNNAAWYFFEMTDDADALVLAAGWADQSIKTEPDYYNYDTMAQLMFVAGEMDLAKKYGTKSVSLARSKGMDPSGTLEMLAQIPD